MEQKYKSTKKQGYDLAKAQSLVESYKNSGLRQTAFCRLHKIKHSTHTTPYFSYPLQKVRGSMHSTFKNWLYRSEEGPLPCPDQSLFTPLKISDPAPEKPLVPVIFPDLQVRHRSWTINIPVGFDGVTLVRLLKLLEV